MRIAPPHEGRCPASLGMLLSRGSFRAPEGDVPPWQRAVGPRGLESARQGKIDSEYTAHPKCEEFDWTRAAALREVKDPRKMPTNQLSALRRLMLHIHSPDFRPHSMLGPRDRASFLEPGFMPVSSLCRTRRSTSSLQCRSGWKSCCTRASSLNTLHLTLSSSPGAYSALLSGNSTESDFWYVPEWTHTRSG